jgi:dihydroorotate dehydrogenase electron transfer subunit
MRALATSPAIHETVVVDRRETLSGIVILGLYAPEIARLVRPGQYAMALPPGGERAATALGVYEARDQRISLMLAVVGVRTRELANLQVGAKLDLLAPLGNGFDLEALRDDVALVAGGVGLASMLLPAQHLAASGRRVHLYYGARTAEALVDESKFAELGIGVSVATDDGTRGYHGFVTELLERDGRAHDVLAACGPSPMLRAVGRIARLRGVRAQLALEETFACGVGACWGCVVAIDRSSPQAPRFPQASSGSDGHTDEASEYVYARICKEGPVFWSDELRW